MLENDKHRRAFEFYYELGDKRTSQLVADEFTVSRRSIEKWKSEFEWKKRIEKRDIEVMQGVERRITKSIIEEKVEYHESIKINTKIINSIISTIVDKVKDRQIKIENMAQYNSALLALERMIKLDLSLLGEPAKILMQFKGEIETKDKTGMEGLSDEQLDKYIIALTKGTVLQIPDREEKEGSKS